MAAGLRNPPAGCGSAPPAPDAHGARRGAQAGDTDRGIALALLLRRYLGELEMKLHLAAEDVALYLQDHSTRAMQRIPAAVKELTRITVGEECDPAAAGQLVSKYPAARGLLHCIGSWGWSHHGSAERDLRSAGPLPGPSAPLPLPLPMPPPLLALLQDDVASVRAAALGTLQQLEEGSSGSAPAVAVLEDLDRVKRRMEAACSTLKEAAGLSALFQRVDDYFASGDLGRVAEALAGMRRGLAVVGDSVAEFRGGRELLARLEEQFAAAVEAPLAAAFAAQKGGC